MGIINESERAQCLTRNICRHFVWGATGRVRQSSSAAHRLARLPWECGTSVVLLVLALKCGEVLFGQNIARTLGLVAALQMARGRLDVGGGAEVHIRSNLVVLIVAVLQPPLVLNSLLCLLREDIKVLQRAVIGCHLRYQLCSLWLRPLLLLLFPLIRHRHFLSEADDDGFCVIVVVAFLSARIGSSGF